MHPVRQAERGDRQRAQVDKTELSGTKHGSQNTIKGNTLDILLAFVQIKQGGSIHSRWSRFVSCT